MDSSTLGVLHTVDMVVVVNCLNESGAFWKGWYVCMCVILERCFHIERRYQHDLVSTKKVHDWDRVWDTLHGK